MISNNGYNQRKHEKEKEEYVKVKKSRKACLSRHEVAMSYLYDHFQR